MRTHPKASTTVLVALVVATFTLAYLTPDPEPATAGTKAAVAKAVKKKVKQEFKRFDLTARILSCRGQGGGRYKCHWFADRPHYFWAEGYAKVMRRDGHTKVRLSRVMSQCVIGGHGC